MHSPKFIRHQLKFLRPRLVMYVQIQLFITLCAWPILAAWGLPLSPASLIGNLLFAPFLSFFLLLSSGILVTELLYIPNGILISLLELTTSLWYSLLTTSSRSWLFATAHPPYGIALLLPLIAYGIMLYRPLSSKLRIYIFIGIYLCASIALPHTFSYHSKMHTLPYYSSHLTLLQSRGHTTLIDPGIIGRHISASKKVSYTLTPFLIKQGVTHLDSIIIPKPSHMVFKALASLVASFPVGTIYIPSFTGTLKNHTWAAWERLLSHAHRYNTRITFVDTPLTIQCGTYTLTLTPHSSVTKKNSFIYRELICTHT